MIRRPAMALVALTAAVVWLGFAWRSPSMLEGWLLAIVILSGFAVASLGLLMIGHLLGDEWLTPVRDELEPASWTMPVIAVLALPLAAGVATLYSWAAADVPIPQGRRGWLTHDWFLVRSLAYLLIWSALAAIIARPGHHKTASAVGLAVLAATYSLASVDWVMSREAQWWSSLFGFAFAVSQLLAGLAAAVLVTVARQGHPEDRQLESLERALLTLSLLTGWVWFAQFLVVWMGNLPGEAGWYFARSGAWQVLNLFVVVPALALAILLLAPTHWGRLRIIGACVLILVHHIAHMVWLIGPAAAAPLGLEGLGAVAILAAVWSLWFAAGLRRHRRMTADQGRAAPRADGGGGRVSPASGASSSGGSGG